MHVLSKIPQHKTQFMFFKIQIGNEIFFAWYNIDSNAYSAEKFIHFVNLDKCSLFCYRDLRARYKTLKKSITQAAREESFFCELYSMKYQQSPTIHMWSRSRNKQQRVYLSRFIMRKNSEQISIKTILRVDSIISLITNYHL